MRKQYSFVLYGFVSHHINVPDTSLVADQCCITANSKNVSKYYIHNHFRPFSGLLMVNKHVTNTGNKNYDYLCMSQNTIINITFNVMQQMVFIVCESNLTLIFTSKVGTCKILTLTNICNRLHWLGTTCNARITRRTAHLLEIQRTPSLSSRQ